MDPFMNQYGPSFVPLSNMYLPFNNQKTTVFVSNISDYTTNNFMHQLLSKCGNVLNWTRVAGTNGRLQSFGFCEYSDQESGLRAMRLLNDLKVGDKILVVKADSKSRSLLEEYESKQKALHNKRVASGQTDLSTPLMTTVRDELDKKAILMIEDVLEKNAPLLAGHCDPSFYQENESNIGMMGLNANINRNQAILQTNSIMSASNMCGFIEENVAVVDGGGGGGRVDSDEEREAKRNERRRKELEQLYRERLNRVVKTEEAIMKDVKRRISKMKSIEKKKSCFEKVVVYSDYDDSVDDEKEYKNEVWKRKLERWADEADFYESYTSKKLLSPQKPPPTELPPPTLPTPPTIVEEPEKTAATSTTHDDNEDEDSIDREFEELVLNKKKTESAPILNMEIDYYNNNNNNQNKNNKLNKFVGAAETKTVLTEQLQEWQNAEHKLTSNSSNLKINLKNTVPSSVFSSIQNVDHEEINTNTDETKKLTKISVNEQMQNPVQNLDQSSLTQEEKKKRIVQIIECLPVARDQVYAEKVLYEHIDEDFVNKRILYWIKIELNKIKSTNLSNNKEKIIENLVHKILNNSLPYELENVLLKENVDTNLVEEFTIKLWRKLVFETVAKRYALLN